MSISSGISGLTSTDSLWWRDDEDLSLWEELELLCLSLSDRSRSLSRLLCFDPLELVLWSLRCRSLSLSLLLCFEPLLLLECCLSFDELLELFNLSDFSRSFPSWFELLLDSLSLVPDDLFSRSLSRSLFLWDDLWDDDEVCLLFPLLLECFSLSRSLSLKKKKNVSG